MAGIGETLRSTPSASFSAFSIYDIAHLDQYPTVFVPVLHVVYRVFEKALAQVLMFGEQDDVFEVAMHQLVFSMHDGMQELDFFFFGVFRVGLVAKSILCPFSHMASIIATNWSE